MKNNSSILSKSEIVTLKEGGRILAEVLKLAVAEVKPGLSTSELDQFIEQSLLERQATPSFKGYDAGFGLIYPAASCISVNSCIVHGMPASDQIIMAGDVVSIDVGAKYKGFHTDAARTVATGIVSEQAALLIKTAKGCLDLAIAFIEPGKTIRELGTLIQKTAEGKGFNVIRDLVGHGVGREIHLPPQIPNFGSGPGGPAFIEGMALAIEPMLVIGSPRIKIESDGWSVSTADGSLAAHWEDTIVIENGRATAVTR